MTPIPTPSTRVVAAAAAAQAAFDALGPVLGRKHFAGKSDPKVIAALGMYCSAHQVTLAEVAWRYARQIGVHADEGPWEDQPYAVRVAYEVFRSTITAADLIALMMPEPEPEPRPVPMSPDRGLTRRSEIGRKSGGIGARAKLR